MLGKLAVLRPNPDAILLVPWRPQMNSKPWFPFYAHIWLCNEDIDAMTLEEEGGYLRLLAHQWTEGSIPTDPVRLRTILKRCDEPTFDRIWNVIRHKFTNSLMRGSERRLANTRLLRVAEEQHRTGLQQAKRVKNRWDKKSRNTESDTIERREEKRREEERNNSSPSSPELPEFALSSEPPVFSFQEFYSGYPRKEGRKQAEAVFKREIKTSQDFENLLKARDNYARIKAGSPAKYIKHCSSFMANWKDYLGTALPGDSTQTPDELEQAELGARRVRELDEARERREIREIREIEEAKKRRDEAWALDEKEFDFNG